MKTRKFLRKIRMVFGEIDQQHHKFWLSVKLSMEYVQKNLEAKLLFIAFSKAFDSMHKGKMEQILQAYCLPKESFTAILILYKYIKAMVHSSNGDTTFPEIFAGILQRNTLVPLVSNLTRLRTTNINRSNEKKYSFTLKNTRSRRYPTETLTDYTDHLVFLANTPAQVKSRLESQK